MSSVKPLSNSCQSVASDGNPSLGSTTIFRSSGAAHYINGTGSLGRLKFHNKHKGLNASDEELDYPQLSQSTHLLGRVKSERFLASKSEEDRRRRTIIIEKKNDSFGFTLQSYAIHYKRDEEVEMITYVDYVEYDGPAYKSGMREGDVILSINGTDMEKADHKTMVEFIKKCENRMRMVVLFEDCVRKVELHMRYIQLQNLLQSKMNELQKVCLRERELLEGKWKTHSLPARKKATSSPTDTDNISPSEGEIPFYRPTLSTEDVAIISRPQTIIPPPAQFMLTYHYLDPTYRYVLKPTTPSSSGEYLASESQLRSTPTESHYRLSRAESGDTATTVSAGTHYASQMQQTQRSVTPSLSNKPPAPPPRTCEKHKPPSKKQQNSQKDQQQTKEETTNSNQKTQKSSKYCHGHSCNPCIGHFRWKSADKTGVSTNGGNGGGNGGADNVSLDAYDLASPCCDSHCVPTRRRFRHHKEHSHKHKHRDRDSKEPSPRSKGQSHNSPSTNRHVHHHHHHTSHEMSPGAQQINVHNLTPAQKQHLHHHHHVQHAQQQQQQQQQQNQGQYNCDSHNESLPSRYFDIASGLASHCSLHSCTSSDFAPVDNTSYTTSISTDTLFWDPKSDQGNSRQHSMKSRQSYHPMQQHQQHSQVNPPQTPINQQQNPSSQTPGHHHHHQHPDKPHVHSVYQHRYHITATQIQPTQVYPNVGYVQKPKSWDNLTTKDVNAYTYGYGYLDTVTIEPIKLQINDQRHSMPRKNPYGRYSTYTDVENYAPPPTEFVEELTTTTTTTITTKSTEELIGTCDCLNIQLQQQHQQQSQQNQNVQAQVAKAAQYHLNHNQKFTHQNTCQLGYYSHLPRPTNDVGTSTASNGPEVATVTEVTRL